MKLIDLGHDGVQAARGGPLWPDLGMPEKWLRAVELIAPGTVPHDIQVAAIKDYELLRSRRNLIISAPTNSGKSLLGYLAILSGVKRGKRAVLLEPYRALAQEKFDELSALLPKLRGILSFVPSVEITTGDYRLNGEHYTSPPPESGELVIATPERLDAIMMNPEYDSWTESVSIICVDEAHILTDRKRGPTLEGVMTRFLLLNSPPRFVLLSATIGSCDRAKEWLDPCDVAQSTVRRPRLQRHLVVIDDEENKDEVVFDLLAEILHEPDSFVILFIYRTDDAERLSLEIAKRFKSLHGENIAAAYHSKLSAAQKEIVRNSCESGITRCVVSTTALGAGVNLPATHVIIRDLTFGQDGGLPIEDIIQMIGRAGRGDREGAAYICLRRTDTWREQELIEQVKSPTLPNLESAFLEGESRNDDALESSARILLVYLARTGRETKSDLERYFVHSLAGEELSKRIDSAVRYLCEPLRVLAFERDGEVGITTLGRAVARSSLPIDVGSGFGALIRDILSADPTDSLLHGWSHFDTLLVLELLDPRESGIKKYSNYLSERIDDYLERSGTASILFQTWIRGVDGYSRAEEVIGSLGLQLKANGEYGKVCRKYAYRATFRAIVINQLSNGIRPQDVSAQWGIRRLDGVQEQWRDHLLWQAAGIGECLDIKSFYYHLKENCDASDVRINELEKIFMEMRLGVYEVLGRLKYCSPLGPLFRDLDTGKVGVGARTKEKLEESGYHEPKEIMKLNETDLCNLGIRRDIAKKLVSYFVRRGL